MKKPSKLLFLIMLSMLVAACGPTSETSDPSVSQNPSTSLPTTTSENPTSAPVVTSEPVITSEPVVTSEPEPSSSEIILPDPIPVGDGTVATANAGVLHYTATDKITVTTSEMEEGAYTLRYTAGIDATLDDLVFYYKNVDAQTGSRYYASFIADVSVITNITVNGTVYELVRGTNTIEFSYDETAGPSLVIKMSDTDNSVKANLVVFSAFSINEVVYDSISDIAIDGDISDWANVRAFENKLNITGITPDTEHKSVDFYAALDETGLFLAVEVHHDILLTDKGAWYTNTNFEFFINGNNQYWVSAGAFKNAKVTSEMVTVAGEEGAANFKTTVEAFVPTAKFPANSVLAGQIRVGFAWKTDGDEITGGEAAGGGYDAYWVPKGTWVSNADQAYVTYNGIFKTNQVNLDAEPQLMTIDGDLSDWAEHAAFTTNFVEQVGTAASAHKSVRFMAIWGDDGLYIAAIAKHDVFVDDNPTWHMNTNLEFFVNGGNQYFVAANGGQSTFTKGAFVSQENTEGEAEFVTYAEAFIPGILLPSRDFQRVGFAWKTNGDTMTGGGGSNGNADAWWFQPGHYPSNANEQYFVTNTGVFTANPLVE